MPKIGDTIKKEHVDAYEAKKLEEAVHKLNADLRLRRPKEA